MKTGVNLPVSGVDTRRRAERYGIAGGYTAMNSRNIAGGGIQRRLSRRDTAIRRISGVGYYRVRA